MQSHGQKRFIKLESSLRVLQPALQLPATASCYLASCTVRVESPARRRRNRSGSTGSPFRFDRLTVPVWLCLRRRCQLHLAMLPSAGGAVGSARFRVLDAGCSRTDRNNSSNWKAHRWTGASLQPALQLPATASCYLASCTVRVESLARRRRNPLPFDRLTFRFGCVFVEGATPCFVLYLVPPNLNE
jgi:hypothetical protein